MAEPVVIGATGQRSMGCRRKDCTAGRALWRALTVGAEGAGRGCQDELNAAVADNEHIGDPASELSDRPMVLAVVLDPYAHRAGLMVIELAGNVSARDAHDHATAARALTEYTPESLRSPAGARRPRRPPLRVLGRLL
ncbi:hypothetical protein ACFWN5_11875 [Streptomyces sp. NPDC058430]|uniref:hypothetical protein n=1 Tax=Streptomyces sp. NPDC058430 TaxID=3346495 RepID=UPI003662F54B